MRTRWWTLVGASVVALAAIAFVNVLGSKSAPIAKRDASKLDLAQRDPEANADAVRIVGHALSAPATSDWCNQLSAANAKTLAKSLLPDAGCAAPELECLVDDAGIGWGFDVRDAGAKLELDTCTSVAEVGVVRSDGSGMLQGPAAARLLLSQNGQPGFSWGIESAHVRALGDYDGDGHQEVLITREWWAHEGGRGADSSVWTFSNGALRLYGPAAGIVIVDVRDTDGDGKLDLVTRGPYGSIEASSALGYRYPNGPAIFLAHVKPDGTFSTNDAVAVAFTASKCRVATEQNETIACERMRGKSEAAVLADLKKSGCVDFAGDLSRYPDSCATWMSEIAAISPPFRIP